MPDLPVGADSERELDHLRWWNLAAALLHLASGAAVIALSNDFTLPLNASYAEDAPGSAQSWPTETVWDVPVGSAAAVFALLSAGAHLAVAIPGWRWYTASLRRGTNPARWIEYSLSASLMIVLIAMLVGIYDIAALIALAGVNAAMILFGWAMEVHNRDRRELGGGNATVSWHAFAFGCVAGAVPWIAIGVYLIGAPDVPGFVYGIFASLFVFFNVFAINMVLEYRRVGPWRRVLFSERAYILLSLTAKLALTWQVFSGALAA